MPAAGLLRGSVEGRRVSLVRGLPWLLVPAGLILALALGTASRPLMTASYLGAVAAVLVLPAGAGFAAGLPVTGAGLAWGAVMGAGTTAFAYVAWYACQRSLSGAQAGLWQLVIPVLTTVGAVALLGEQLSASLLIAAVLVGAGLWLGRPAPAREPAPAPLASGA